MDEPEPYKGSEGLRVQGQPERFQKFRFIARHPLSEWVWWLAAVRGEVYKRGPLWK